MTMGTSRGDREAFIVCCWRLALIAPSEISGASKEPGESAQPKFQMKGRSAKTWSAGFVRDDPMTLHEFTNEMRVAAEDDHLMDFARRYILHGTPYVFRDREADYYNFKRRLCGKFGVELPEVFVVGSAKLGYSPHKRTDFTLDSDIDLAIVSGDLFLRTSELAASLEFRIRSQTVLLQQHHWKSYHRYLRHLVIGWMRPDLLPRVDPCIEFKDDWFSFFDELSYGKAEVGNYKVTAGVFRSHRDLERYTVDSVKRIRNALLVGGPQ